VAGMRAAEAILVPFLLSAFIAIVSAPSLFWLQRRGLPTALALLLVIAAILIAGGVLGALIGNSIQDFSQALPEYQARLQSEFAGLIAWFGTLGIDISGAKLQEHFDPGAAMRLAASTLAGFGGALTNAFLILLTVVFILLEASSLPQKIHAALDRPGASLAGFERFVENVQRYMAIKSIVSLITGLVIATGLWLIGVDYPLLWGMLAFLLNYVPNIGSIIAAVPAVLLAFVQLGALSALLAAALYVAVNMIIGNALEPRFMGRGLGLSTLVVFLSLVFWGWVLGPVGMLLSVPLTITVKIALESGGESHWLAVLLGPESDAAIVEKEDG
ncbi:MAG: AI-2E family transporter, partial [Gammaproteobacteria bacterium]|nr:AI-2E family transporter [Gammaproteobacteria bacterium]